jgi:ABC-type transport system involved in multi-copper enzyme maturation permease subunit
VGLWGVLLIARERTPNTLEFLAAAPVSRREIAVTKFFFGAMSIIGMMTVNLLFVLGIMLVAPVGYTWTEALFWFAFCVSYLLSLFSLGFLIAVVTGNWVANLGAVLLCSHLHWLLADTIRFFGLPMGLSDSALERIRNGLEYIDLFFYLSYYAIGQVHMGHVAALFTAFLVLGMLSLRLFEKSPLEKNGQAFVFGSARLFWRFFIPLIPAALVGYVFSFNWISGLLSAGLAYVAGIRVADYLMRQMEGNVIGAR